MSKSEVMIVAGEASGDRLGADLVEEIRTKRRDVSFFGTPGPAMRGAGVESIFDSDSWSIVGIGAVAKAVPRFLKTLSELRRVAKAKRPAAVVLIDFPEFNLKLARALKKDGHKVIYYVSPQVWAWRKYRVRTIRKSVDLLLSILPFEKRWYADQGITHVEFVGNPIVKRANPTKSRSEFLEQYGFDTGNRFVALLPGSRGKEIRRHLHQMLEAAASLKVDDPNLQFAISAADTDAMREIEKRSIGYGDIPLIEGDTLNLLNAADAAAISSGTATLEAGIVGTPMVVVYKLPKIDFNLFRPFVNVPYIALINLIAGKSLVTELVQDDFTAARLARELKKLLVPAENARMREALKQAGNSLDSGNSTSVAADAVIRIMDARSKSDVSI